MKKTLGIKTIGLLKKIALICGLLAFVVCVLIIVNYLQLKRSDPLNAPAVQILVEKMHSNPDDEQVKAEIRELDLLARKAYFTNQWQIKTGGYILLVSLISLVICIKIIESNKELIPQVPSSEQDDIWVGLKLKRTWVAYSGTGLAAIALLFAFLTHNELGRTLNKSFGTAGTLKESSKNRPGNLIQQINSDSISESNSAVTNPTIAGSDFPTLKEINSNFPSFRGPGSYGVALKSNIPTNWDGRSGKNIKWKTPIPLPGYNSPIVWNNNVYVSGASETKREVYCFDATTGKLKWKYTLDKIPGGTSQVPKVNKETGLSAPSMVTNGRNEYAVFANGDMVALDTSGKKIWAKSLGLPSNHYGHASSLIMYHDMVIVQYDQTSGAAVMALSAKTGEVVWKTTRNVKVSWSSPILASTSSRQELILAAEPYVIAYNPASGKELWRMDCISGEVGPSLAYADGVVFSVNEYSKLTAIRVGEQPTQLWENTEYLSDIPSPVANKSYLFLATSYGTMVCYDAKTGTKYWEKDFGTPLFASPMLAEGRIYQMDKKGVMHIFRADKTFSSVSEPQLGEGSACTPAFGSGRIFIRGDKNLYCIGK
jgi:outer membrane protein assembly factor BamB